MTPDDARHGTAAGYQTGGCRDTCCRRAWAMRSKRYRLMRYRGQSARYGNLGVVRRLQALAVLGWGTGEIARRYGMNERHLVKLRQGHYQRVNAPTVARICQVYDDLCMTLPVSTTRTRMVSNRARRLGWFPPLCWDDIDDPNEEPPWRYLAENEDAA